MKKTFLHPSHSIFDAQGQRHRYRLQGKNVDAHVADAYADVSSADVAASIVTVVVVNAAVADYVAVSFVDSTADVDAVDAYRIVVVVEDDVPFACHADVDTASAFVPDYTAVVDAVDAYHVVAADDIAFVLQGCFYIGSAFSGRVF